MAQRKILGTTLFGSTIYSADGVDQLIEEHSHYIVSPNGNTSIRPLDDGNGVIDRHITVQKAYEIDTAAGTVFEGYTEHDGEIDVIWDYPHEPSSEQSKIEFIGPYYDYYGNEVYVPIYSPVRTGFNNKAYYANLWITKDRSTEYHAPESLTIRAGTSISTGFLPPVKSVSFTSDTVYQLPQTVGRFTISPSSGDSRIIKVGHSIGLIGHIYDISVQFSDGSYEDVFTIEWNGGADASIRPVSATTVSPSDSLSVYVPSSGYVYVYNIHYKGYPQLFHFDDDGVFQGDHVRIASGYAEGHTVGGESSVIDDERVIATLKDLDGIIASSTMAEYPIGVTSPTGDITIYHESPEGLVPGTYGDRLGSRAIGFGESFNTVVQDIDATGHVTGINDVAITMPVDASELMVGDESNDMSVKDAINDIRDEIGGGGGSSITDRLDAIEDRLDSNDLELEELEKRVDGLYTSIEYWDLWDLRYDGKLVPGTSYRITDYVATTTQSLTRSANHPFDIIVTADSPTSLSEVARAVLHEGDEYFSSAGSKLEAWKVWYCFDNDQDRFAWADKGGTGVIYRLIDEFGNDCPYDFKGIVMRPRNETDNVYRYTFDSGSNSENTDVSLNDSGAVYNNRIDPANNLSLSSSGDRKRLINRNVFKGYNSHSNSFEFGCMDNVVYDSCNNNTFGRNCGANILGSRCLRNTFGNGCNFNTLGEGCTSNVMLGSFGSHFGSSCSSNFLFATANWIYLGDYCYSNTFGPGCMYVVFGKKPDDFSEDVQYHPGDLVYYTGGGAVYRCTAEHLGGWNSSHFSLDWDAAVLSRYSNITFEKDIEYVFLERPPSLQERYQFTNVDVKTGVSGEQSQPKAIIADSRGYDQYRHTIYQPAGSRVISV